MTDRCAENFDSQASWPEWDGFGEVDRQLLATLGLSFYAPPGAPPGSPFISEFGDTRSLQFDHRNVQSSMSISNPSGLEIEYTRVMMGFLLFNPAPRFIDMIGLGGGSLAKYCHRNLPSSIVTAIEIKAEVIALRDRFMIPQDDERFRVILGDGANYVRERRRLADVLLIDGFESNGQPPELCTQGFYDACYNHLAPGGIMVANLWDQAGLCINRLRKSFGRNVIVLRTQGGDNRAAFAIKTPGRFPAPDFERYLSMHDEANAPFLAHLATRLAQQLALHDHY